MGAAGMLVLLFVGIATCLTPVACNSNLTQQYLGIATYYDPPYVPSACFGNQDRGPYVVAVGEFIWNNGAACGGALAAACIGAAEEGVPNPCIPGAGSIQVTIVDHCPGCETFALSRDSFSLIADPNAGNIAVQYMFN